MGCKVERACFKCPGTFTRVEVWPGPPPAVNACYKNEWLRISLKQNHCEYYSGEQHFIYSVIFPVVPDSSLHQKILYIRDCGLGIGVSP